MPSNESLSTVKGKRVMRYMTCRTGRGTPKITSTMTASTTNW
jgi:hypothetical protein